MVFVLAFLFLSTLCSRDGTGKTKKNLRKTELLQWGHLTAIIHQSLRSAQCLRYFAKSTNSNNWSWICNPLGELSWHIVGHSFYFLKKSTKRNVAVQLSKLNEFRMNSKWFEVFGRKWKNLTKRYPYKISLKRDKKECKLQTPRVDMLQGTIPLAVGGTVKVSFLRLLIFFFSKLQNAWVASVACDLVAGANLGYSRAGEISGNHQQKSQLAWVKNLRISVAITKSTEISSAEVSSFLMSLPMPCYWFFVWSFFFFFFSQASERAIPRVPSRERFCPFRIVRNRIKVIAKAAQVRNWFCSRRLRG